METVRPRVSYADLERAPEEGRRYELYDGEVYVVPAPIPLHQVVVYNLVEELRAICRQAGGFAIGSPIDIVFSDYDVVQPDVILFGPARGVPRRSGRDNYRRKCCDRGGRVWSFPR